MSKREQILTARCLLQVALDQVENALAELPEPLHTDIDEAADAAYRATNQLTLALQRLDALLSVPVTV